MPQPTCRSAGGVRYELRRTGRKTVECRVGAEGAVVFAPLSTPVAVIDAFVRQNAAAIEAAQTRRAQSLQAAKERLNGLLTDGAPIPVEGKQRTLRLPPGSSGAPTLTGDELIVPGASDAGETLRRLRSFLSALALERIEARVAFFAARIGVRPSRIAVREQKTLWGSCSSRGRLSFNRKLIMAPPQALDYVVVHELCHMVHPNHSPAFWALVERHMPDFRTWRDYLNRDFTAPF